MRLRRNMTTRKVPTAERQGANAPLGIRGVPRDTFCDAYPGTHHGVPDLGMQELSLQKVLNAEGWETSEEFESNNF